MGADRPLVIDEVRMLAWNFLQRIEHSEAFVDLHLENAFSKDSPLRPLDRAFLLELVLGTLRWRSRLDGAIRRAAKFPGKKIDPRLLHLLRLGVYQILFMDRVPHSAAVNESVRLATAVFKNKKISGLPMPF
jgi:16S rRNA (cytosine967-C5)-methyltransferase